MYANFKGPTRREIIIVAVMLGIFLILYYRKGDHVPPENQLSTPRQTDHRKEEPERQAGTAELAEIWRPGYQQPPPSSSLPERITSVTPVSHVVPKINSTLQQARLIYKVDPIYPETLKEYGLSGGVPLDVTVDEKGSVTEVVVTEQTVGVNEAFAEAAVTAVEQWRYEPALINGIPASVSFGIVITFDSNGSVGSHEQSVEPDSSMFITEYTVGPMRSAPPAQNYNGRTYYTVTSGMSAPVVRVDVPRLQSMAQASWPPFDVYSQPPVIVYSIFINENGSVAGFEKRLGPIITSLEEELKSIRVISPAGFNGEAIPSWMLLTIDLR